jgi:hypothetical protein
VSHDDLVDKFIRFESDEMEDDETIDFFQYLVDTGMVWRLQGSYGRMAQYLIELGVVSDRPTVTH